MEGGGDFKRGTRPSLFSVGEEIHSHHDLRLGRLGADFPGQLSLCGQNFSRVASSAADFDGFCMAQPQHWLLSGEQRKRIGRSKGDGVGWMLRFHSTVQWLCVSLFVFCFLQGMNKLAAFALLTLEEEQAFWAMAAVVEDIMRFEYYRFPLIGSRIDQHIFLGQLAAENVGKDVLLQEPLSSDPCYDTNPVARMARPPMSSDTWGVFYLFFSDFVQHELPEVAAHFDHIGFDLETTSFRWFFTAFVSSLPMRVTLRIWDAYLAEGRTV